MLSVLRAASALQTLGFAHSADPSSGAMFVAGARMRARTRHFWGILEGDLWSPNS
jgi:hypothetical protein